MPTPNPLEIHMWDISPHCAWSLSKNKPEGLTKLCVYSEDAKQTAKALRGFLSVFPTELVELKRDEEDGATFETIATKGETKTRILMSSEIFVPPTVFPLLLAEPGNIFVSPMLLPPHLAARAGRFGQEIATSWLSKAIPIEGLEMSTLFLQKNELPGPPPVRAYGSSVILLKADQIGWPQMERWSINSETYKNADIARL